MNHPCTVNYAFSRGNALGNYTLEAITAEIEQTSKFIPLKLAEYAFKLCLSL